MCYVCLYLYLATYLPFDLTMRHVCVCRLDGSPQNEFIRVHITCCTCSYGYVCIISVTQLFFFSGLFRIRPGCAHKEAPQTSRQVHYQETTDVQIRREGYKVSVRRGGTQNADIKWDCIPDDILRSEDTRGTPKQYIGTSITGHHRNNVKIFYSTKIDLPIVPIHFHL